MTGEGDGERNGNGNGNAQALRDASAGWREMGRHVEEIVRDLDHQVAAARAAHWRGPAADAFAADWHRLRSTVDEAVPVFAMAAADLDGAADRMEQPQAADGSESVDTGETGGTVPEPPEEPGAGAYTVAFAMAALGQIGAALGATLGRGRTAAAARGRGTPPTRSAADSPATAPPSADPFGPPEVSAPPKERPRGGLGIAGGVRTSAKGPDGEAPGDPAAGRAAAPQPRPEPKPETGTRGAFG